MKQRDKQWWIISTCIMRDCLINTYNLNGIVSHLYINFRLENESVEKIIYNLIKTKLSILQFINSDKNSEIPTILFKITSKMEIRIWYKEKDKKEISSN